MVTLAFFLGLQGVMLLIIGEGGTIAYRNEVILALKQDPMPVWLGWTLAVVRSRGYAGADLAHRRTGVASTAWRASPCCCGRIKTGGLVIVVLLFVGLPVAWSAARNPALKSLKGVPDRRRRSSSGC